MTVSAHVPSRRGPLSGKGGEVHFRILATTDLHAHLFPFNYYNDQRDDSVGLARVAPLIERARADHPNCLLFDNGDTIQGAPLGDAAMSGLFPDGETHPMIAAMNGLGYDAATIGNHDFDFGLDKLYAAVGKAAYPAVLCNARMTDGGAPAFAKHVILKRNFTDTSGTTHAFRIGVTGAVPTQTAQWCKAHLRGRLEIGPILPAVAASASALRALGADLVIVLAHSGLGKSSDGGAGENVGLRVAALDGVDAVIAGHTHRSFPETSVSSGPGVVPIVQPGFWGSHLGQIDLTLQPRTKDCAWQVSASCAQLLSPSEDHAPQKSFRHLLRQRPAFRVQMARGHRLTRSYSAQPVGRSAVALESYFSLLAPCAATQLIADAQRAAAAEVLLDYPHLAGLPLVSVVAPFKSGGRNGPAHYTDVPAGALLLRNIADLYLYANGMSLLKATGAQIRDWLERSTAVFRTIVPGGDGGGQPQTLIAPGAAGYNFDRLEGLRYTIDLSQPARTSPDGERRFETEGRIGNLRFDDGRLLKEEDECLLITNSYRAAGGGHFPAATQAETVFATIDPVRDALVEYVSKAKNPLAPVVDPTWEFASLGGTDVLFETGPGALGHADRIKALGARSTGLMPSGFHGFHLRL